MMSPCMCGDPYCASCGNPRLAEAEAAVDQAMTRLAEAKLTPEEYKLAVDFGLQAVEATRAAVKAYQDRQRFLREESDSIDQMMRHDRTVPPWADQS